MQTNIAIGSKLVISAGSFFMAAAEKMAQISLPNVDFILYVYNPAAGESAPNFQPQKGLTHHTTVPGSFTVIPCGDNSEYSVRIKVSEAWEPKNGYYLVEYSVHVS